MIISIDADEGDVDLLELELGTGYLPSSPSPCSSHTRFGFARQLGQRPNVSKTKF